MQKVSKRSLIAIIGLIVVLIALIGILFTVFSLNTDVTTLKKQVEQQEVAISKQNAMLQNESDTNKSLLSLAVVPTTNQLYLPETGVVIPFSDLGRTIAYTVDTATVNEGEAPNIRVQSTSVYDHEERRVSCFDMVRLRIEDTPNAYSPSQPLYATVTLSNNRKLQIYASTGPKECVDEVWSNSITPQQIAELFKQAQVL